MKRKIWQGDIKINAIIGVYCLAAGMKDLPANVRSQSKVALSGSVLFRLMSVAGLLNSCLLLGHHMIWLQESLLVLLTFIPPDISVGIRSRDAQGVNVTGLRGILIV